MTPAFEFKGRVLNLTVMRLLTTDLEAITARLGSHVEKAPSFLVGAPVMLDLEMLDKEATLDLPGLVYRVRAQGLMPIAVCGATPSQQEHARALGLGSIDWAKETAWRASPSSHKSTDAPELHAASSTPTRVVTQMVRSGQQIYARGGDLLVLNQVSTGAEVIADGHIHIYGSLRGRALAGAQGYSGARIFCKHFNPELIAIAGVYRVSEDIDEALRGGSIQAYLRADELALEPI